jgi:hypothetical protein
VAGCKIGHQVEVREVVAVVAVLQRVSGGNFASVMEPGNVKDEVERTKNVTMFARFTLAMILEPFSEQVIQLLGKKH